jgi:DNA primase
MVDVRALLLGAGITPQRESSDEIFALCPMHLVRTGRVDHRPSWSINTVKLVHSCFSCGYSGSIKDLLRDVTGTVPDDIDQEMAKTGFLEKMRRARAEPEEALAPVIPLLTEWSLHHLEDVPQRLLDFRMLQRAAIDAYEVRWQGDTKQWVLPLRSSGGDLLGAQYRQKGNVVTLPEGMKKQHTLFGFRQCEDQNHVAVVESPLDAVRLYGLGIPAVSPLGAWVSNDQVKLLARNFTRVYLALDNDKAGRESSARLRPVLRRAGTAVMAWDYTGLVDDEGHPAKDPGDVADDDMLLGAWKRTVRFGLL